jgi:hypothetical protein
MVIDMAHRAIIQNHDIGKFINEILITSAVVGRHSSVIYVRNDGKEIKGMEYVWSNQDIQPWGYRLPPQCEKCLSFRPWGRKAVGLGGVASNISFACEGVTVEGKRCNMVKTYRKPGNINRLAGSDWLWYSWPRTQVDGSGMSHV